MEIIDQMNREKVLYLLFFSISYLCFFLVLFFWGYFGVGSGTHYMYFRGEDDEIIKIL